MIYNFFKQLYEKYSTPKEEPKQQWEVESKQLRIPKIIHQIWLGGPFPEKYREYQKTWLMHHPDWEFKLWMDEDVEYFSFKNRDLFDQATNYGEKSDLWCYEILEQYGGLYIDIDFECLASLEILHYLYDFYIGVQPLDTNAVQLGLGIIGSIPHHPLLQRCVQEVRKSYEKNIKQIVLKTGPFFFTQLFIRYGGIFGLKDIVLPAGYFYPRGYTQRLSQTREWLRPESLAVHHWAGSWL
jgi:mannosyltransferase OCH1-like enzyme